MPSVGFSSLSGAAKAPTIPQCGACGLSRQCNSPKMPVSGEGRRGILIVGEAPGAFEDKEGVQFVGKTGRFLESELARFDIDMRRDCWLTNSLICHPKDAAGRNRTPTPKEIAYCRPNLLSAVRHLKPEVIVLLGKPALQSLLGWTWKEDLGPIGKWVGWRIPDRRLNCWICPAWHPSYVTRERDKARGDGDLATLFYRQHLEAISQLSGRPWPDPPPDPAKLVEVCLDTRRAAEFLRQLVRSGEGPVAFDYETTCLKPEGPHSRIHSCAVCWKGRATVAYPWHGEAVAATGELLASDIPKMAHGAKFELRWSLREFGRPVRNMKWCSMTAAHILDGRAGITGLKFQALVRLGVGPYNEEVEPFLKSAKPGCYSPNRIAECDLRKVLRYNALDALLEYELAMKQMEDLGVQP